jgi:hypothetical protein
MPPWFLVRITAITGAEIAKAQGYQEPRVDKSPCTRSR